MTAYLVSLNYLLDKDGEPLGGISLGQRIKGSFHKAGSFQVPFFISIPEPVRKSNPAPLYSRRPVLYTGVSLPKGEYCHEIY